jgi:hypothetical protein
MDINIYSGSEYAYEFQALPYIANEEHISEYCAKTRSLISKITKEFSDEINTQWVVRNYLAVKYICAASITLGAAIYGERKNTLITRPYCSYYAILYCCRAFLFTVPDFEWKGIESVKKTHSSILNLTENYLRRLNSDAASKWGGLLKTAQAQRELYSYRFPATGLALMQDNTISLEDVTEICRLLTDLAKLNSDCLESSLRKNAPGDFKIIYGDDLAIAMTYEVDGVEKEDDDDYYRIGYQVRKFSTVSNLAFMATDGLRDDYFGNWTADDDCDGDAFNPDDYMYYLLN